MKVLVTGAAGNAGQAVTRLLANEGFTLRLADVAPPPGGEVGAGLDRIGSN